MLAALGRSVVAVRQRPRVAILSGGDELVEPDGDVSGGRIVASNSYSLAAQCRELGAEPVHLGIARDDPEDLERRFRAGLRSRRAGELRRRLGRRPRLRAPRAREARLHAGLLGRARSSPASRSGFGRFAAGDGPLVFGLPGNPVSAMMTFEQFVRPALLKMAGHRVCFARCVRATLAERLAEGRPGACTSCASRSSRGGPADRAQHRHAELGRAALDARGAGC